MNHLKQIVSHAERLPDPLQKEVLDFIEYLEFKTAHSPELSDREWKNFSVTQALQGMEEENVSYSLSDLKEKF